MSNRSMPFLALALLAATGPHARADLSQSTAPSPGGFLQVGAFETSCACSIPPGGDLRLFSAGPDFAEGTFLPAQEPSLGVSRVTADVTISASGVAGMGFVRGAAARYSPDTGWFAAGLLNGGWNDVLTVSHPDRAGLPGVLVFQARVRAGLRAADLTGSALCEVAVYKDGAQVPVNPLYDQGNADTSFGGNQWARWGIAAYGGSDAVTRAVDGVVTFAVPITFGQPFRLGVYSLAFAGQRSSGGFGGTWSRCSIDFSQGMTWNGVTGVYADGAPVSGVTIGAASGTDWGAPYGGCPADVNGDGFLDFFDYDDFVSAFESGGSVADFNGDGFVDFFDYDDFVGAFETGC